MTDHTTIATTERVELAEDQLHDVTGGNWFIGVAGGVLANFIYDAITGRDNGGVVGAVTRAMSRL